MSNRKAELLHMRLMYAKKRSCMVQPDTIHTASSLPSSEQAPISSKNIYASMILESDRGEAVEMVSECDANTCTSKMLL